jgi:hypothetical protein
MSERWKYQLKTGTFWGLFMSLFSLIFRLNEVSLSQQLSSVEFYVRLAGFVILGIFVLGYFNWRSRQKRQQQ